MGDPSNSGSDQSKACAEALQAAQKRVRLAFFLLMAASSITLLIVINLLNTLLIQDKLINSNSPDGLGYLKEYSKQVAGQSFYQIPSLGVQITCDDVGLLGPLALLAFSFYCLITLRACLCHVKCAASRNFAQNPLISALLETERFTDDRSRLTQFLSSLPRRLLFLPFIVCVAITCYCGYAHFFKLFYDPSQGTLSAILRATRPLAICLDVVGFLATAAVWFSNRAAFRFATTKEKIAKHAKGKPPRGPAQAATQTAGK